MTAPKEIYVNDQTYNNLLERLIKLVEDPIEHHGTDARSELILALGDEGGIWPEMVLEDRVA